MAFSASSSVSAGEVLCQVCGDQATGRHYGATSCNGCKGFFRRTVRKGFKYACRFEGPCNVDKPNRAACRYCRYMRCVNAGMKEEAVQCERDFIGKRQHSSSIGSAQIDVHNPYAVYSAPSDSPPVTNKRRQSHGNDLRDSTKTRSPPDGSLSTAEAPHWETPQSLLTSLLHSETLIQSIRETVVKQTETVEYSTRPEEPRAPDMAGGRAATVNDLFTSVRSQLLLVIEWAKTLPPFVALSTEDQTALLRYFASQHLMLGVAYRSVGAANSLKLINHSHISRVTRRGDDMDLYAQNCERVLHELVAPMRFLKIDETEFVAMKACILFNPVARGLSSSTVMSVLATRRKIFAALESHCRLARPEDPNRIGDLSFFILSPLQSLANGFSDNVLASKLSGAARLDLLMEELILSDEKEEKFVMRTSEGGASRSSQDQHLEQMENEPDDQVAQSSSLLNEFFTPSTVYASISDDSLPHHHSMPSQERPLEKMDFFDSLLAPSNKQLDHSSHQMNSTLSQYILGPYDPYLGGGWRRAF